MTTTLKEKRVLLENSVQVGLGAEIPNACTNCNLSCVGTDCGKSPFHIVRMSPQVNAGFNPFSDLSIRRRGYRIVNFGSDMTHRKWRKAIREIKAICITMIGTADGHVTPLYNGFTIVGCKISKSLPILDFSTNIE